MNEWTELSTDELLYHHGRIAYLMEKFREDSRLGLLDPSKAKEDWEYYNDIWRDLADVAYELENRGYYEDNESGEWKESE
jgi:hypothetical protein